MRNVGRMLLSFAVLLAAAPALGTFCVQFGHWGIAWTADSSHVVFHSFEVNDNDGYALLTQDGRHPSLLRALDVETGRFFQLDAAPPLHVDARTGRLFLSERRGVMTAERPGAPWTGPLTRPEAGLHYNPEEETLTAVGWWDEGMYYHVIASASGAILGSAGIEGYWGWKTVTDGRYLDYFGDYQQTHVMRLDLRTGNCVPHPELGGKALAVTSIPKTDFDQVAMFVYTDEIRVREGDGSLKPVRISEDPDDLAHVRRFRGVVGLERSRQEDTPLPVPASCCYAWGDGAGADWLIRIPHRKDIRVLPCGGAIVAIGDEGLILLRAGRGGIEVLDPEMGEIHATSNDHLICAPPDSENREELRQRVELPADLCAGIPVPTPHPVSEYRGQRLRTPENAVALLLGGADFVENASPEVLEDFRFEPARRRTLTRWKGKPVLARRGGKLMLRGVDGEWSELTGVRSFGIEMDLVLEAEVSPDGNRIAILYNAINDLRNPLGVLVVYDRSTGQEVARVDVLQECADVYGY